MMMYALGRDRSHTNLNRAEFREHLAQARKAVVSAAKLSTTEKSKGYLKSIEDDIEKYAVFFEQASSLIAAGRPMPALAICRDQAGTIGARMEDTSAQYIALQRAQFAAAEADAEAQRTASIWMSLLFVIAGLSVAGIITMVVRRITKQLRTMTDRLSDGAAQIASGSGQVSSSSQTLAQGASEQAASLEETSASAEEITSMTRQNAANTGQVAHLMATVDERIVESNNTLSLMIASMKQINASSDRISKIIKVIDEIAFQTNILALNAAVEAARAGEAGMGFAVVADEVRNLAQRSAQAAKDTAALIEESIATSNEGSTRLQKVADVVGSITEAASKVKVLVDEVNIGSQEQAKGIEEIARSLSEMDRVTQGTAAAAEESASASEEMSAQAQALAKIVDELRAMSGSDH
jgi:methyl-accepting chemotaxis protein/methyl-accepting chemotaxis protein-1 (serine sensor receptor)